MPAGKSKKTGNGSGRHKIQKRKSRARFGARHIDQVFEDYMKPPGEVLDGKHGPVGTSGRVEFDDDVPGRGQHYCIACAKHFTDAAALKSHTTTKPHKRSVAKLASMALSGTKPHTAADAEASAGMGRPDNGLRLSSLQAVQDATMGT